MANERALSGGDWPRAPEGAPVTRGGEVTVGPSLRYPRIFRQEGDRMHTEKKLCFPGGVGAIVLAVAATASTASAPAPRGMVWVPGGEFTMGSRAADARPVEGPTRRVRVDGFWIDATEVTNAQFKEFVKATGYRTTAEKAPTLEEVMKQLPPGTPPPPKDVLVPGSMVFVPPAEPVRLHRYDLWWKWAPGRIDRNQRPARR